MKLLTNLLIYSGLYHILSSIIFYTLIRVFTYDKLQLQYSQGGIEAVFTITESNYHFGIILTLVFAAAAILKGLELKQEGRLSTVRTTANSALALITILSAIYFTFLNLLILFNPSYF